MRVVSLNILQLTFLFCRNSLKIVYILNIIRLWEDKGERIMIKRLNKYLASLLVALSIISIGNIANAAHINTVLYRWQSIGQTTTDGFVFNYETNHQYKDITFLNGYTYKQSSENITSFRDIVGGIFSRVQYTRTFSTY